MAKDIKCINCQKCNIITKRKSPYKGLYGCDTSDDGFLGDLHMVSTSVIGECEDFEERQKQVLEGVEFVIQRADGLFLGNPNALENHPFVKNMKFIRMFPLEELAMMVMHKHGHKFGESSIKPVKITYEVLD